MRDVKRIKRILGKLETKWLENPDLRFCQLLCNYGIIPYNPGKDNFYLEDDTLEEYVLGGTPNNIKIKKAVAAIRSIKHDKACMNELDKMLKKSEKGSFKNIKEKRNDG
jgi:hypothetical protein